MKPRVVFDCMVFLQGAGRPGGPASACLTLVDDDRVELVLSDETLSVLGIRLKHTDQFGKWRDAVDGNLNIPVKVHAKKTKLTTDALAGFDDL